MYKLKYRRIGQLLLLFTKTAIFVSTIFSRSFSSLFCKQNFKISFHSVTLSKVWRWRICQVFLFFEVKGFMCYFLLHSSWWKIFCHKRKLVNERIFLLYIYLFFKKQNFKVIFSPMLLLNVWILVCIMKKYDIILGWDV